MIVSRLLLGLPDLVHLVPSASGGLCETMQQATKAQLVQATQRYRVGVLDSTLQQIELDFGTEAARQLESVLRELHIRPRQDGRIANIPLRSASEFDQCVERELLYAAAHNIVLFSNRFRSQTEKVLQLCFEHHGISSVKLWDGSGSPRIYRNPARHSAEPTTAPALLSGGFLGLPMLSLPFLVLLFELIRQQRSRTAASGPPQQTNEANLAIPPGNMAEDSEAPLLAEAAPLRSSIAPPAAPSAEDSASSHQPDQDFSDGTHRAASPEASEALAVSVQQGKPADTATAARLATQADAQTFTAQDANSGGETPSRQANLATVGDFNLERQPSVELAAGPVAEPAVSDRASSARPVTDEPTDEPVGELKIETPLASDPLAPNFSATDSPEDLSEVDLSIADLPETDSPLDPPEPKSPAADPLTADSPEADPPKTNSPSDPPAVNSPNTDPPLNPPETDPPVVNPPQADPPKANPPSDPPAVNSPNTDPPLNPPETDPPVVNPPQADPPKANPPSDPPAVNSPNTDPPLNPPETDPPVVNPPQADPPKANPPEVEPPEVEPPEVDSPTPDIPDVEPLGQVTVHYLLDGGSHEGELGIFSLRGLDLASWGTPAFEQAVVQRVMSNSPLGYRLFSDAAESAQFNQIVDWQTLTPADLTTTSAKTVALPVGELFSFVLIPNGTFADLATALAEGDPISASLRPLFANAQIKKLAAEGTVWGWEDKEITGSSDRDYDDLIFGLSERSADMVEVGLDAAIQAWQVSDVDAADFGIADSQSEIALTQEIQRVQADAEQLGAQGLPELPAELSDTLPAIGSDQPDWGA
ncbi:MAG: hypothetical protein F6J97_13570 [Leptolyngbya sp. SIO4C1]|nr:hypothetical protein [Leptolyngbya sp. SIO4C1]